MNIDFKALAKTALVVGALAATMGANAFTNRVQFDSNSQAVLAACQLQSSVFSHKVGVFNSGVADIVASAVGSQDKMMDVFVQSGACEILQTYQAKVNASTTYDQESELADKATDAIIDPLAVALHKDYSDNMMALFGEKIAPPATLVQPVSHVSPATGYDNSPGM